VAVQVVVVQFSWPKGRKMRQGFVKKAKFYQNTGAL
jgi:hypothetical protein